MKFSAFILVSALFLTGCSTDTIKNGIPNLVQVAPGVYRGGQPSDTGWEWLRYMGVTNVVKLNEESESTENYADIIGMEIWRFPIPLKNQLVGPVDLALIDQAVAHIGTNVFVHCQHGNDRTGLVIARYRMLHGWSKASAEHEMIALGFHKELRGLWECWEYKIK